ncbi:hypothetical protein niasHT_020306 [Heterodera trifolii]|uniref:Uncharacterized protein n=1 Tax=Heterodera trifolii TaxID=157864 RepID=A0ABD2JQP6_9BILA
MNRSNSELYISNFVLFVSALLVDQMARLHSQFGATARPKASPALRLLADKANAAAEDALRHFGSTAQLCVMNTILNFVWEVNIEKKAENVTKKAVKKLGTSECEEWRVQRQAMAEAMATRLGTLITAAIAELLMIDKAKVQSALKYPGAQIRLLRLAGTVKRVDQLTEHFDLAQLFANNALTNDDDFWVHYLHAMCRADKIIERKSHKFGADLAAFVRWLRQKLTAKKRWVGQIHAEEMRKLLKNGKLSQLSEVLNVFGSKTIREGLLQFFNGNEIDELFNDFKLKENKKTQIENLKNYFNEDEENDENEEEFEQSEEELDEEDEEGENGREGEFEGDETAKKLKEIMAPENAKECAKRMSDRKEGEILECDQTEDNLLSDHRQNECRSTVPSPSSANVSAFSVLDFDLLSLTDHFVNLFCQMDNDPSRLSKIGLMRNTEMRAIIFYYRHCVDRLFNFGQLKWENGIFNERIGTFKKKWDKIKTIGRENEGKLEQKMCQIYQFVYQMVKDDKLMRMNGKWGRNLAENVAQFGEDTFEHISNGRLILLADRPRQWHRIDCANRSEADELVNEVRLHCPQLMEGVHLLALAHLIGKSGKMRDTLANGTEENILWMKHKISSTVSHRVLNKLEMVHPEVMHYEHLSISHLLVLLLRQLEFKSGTLAAENAGVRISSPFLLGAINEIENNLRKNDSTKTAEEKAIFEVLLMIIRREKAKFYAQLAKANETNLLLRKAFCPLFMFFILAENIDKGQLKVGKADVMREWNARKCEEEEVVKRQAKRKDKSGRGGHAEEQGH